MRVVIACCGLEHTMRGFESFSTELFRALSDHVDVTLCKGSGKRRPHEVVVPCLRRDFLSRFIDPRTAFHWEQISFAIALFPYLILKRIDVVHYSEGRLGNVLARLIRLTRSRIKLVQSNGGPISPMHFRPEVFIHQVCQAGFDQALDFGIAATRMQLLPYGIDPQRFQYQEAPRGARGRLNLPIDSFLVLSLAALDKQHKRLDYLIREVAALQDRSVYLCMAGEPTVETPELRIMAEELLPGRHTFITLPRSRIPELLSVADLFVLPSLNEGFGMVLIEACSARVPVVCHNSAHFQWVMGDAALYTDMTKGGALTATIMEVIHQRQILERIKALGTARVEKLYDWKILVHSYLRMYRSIAEM